MTRVQTVAEGPSSGAQIVNRQTDRAHAALGQKRHLRKVRLWRAKRTFANCQWRVSPATDYKYCSRNKVYSKGLGVGIPTQPCLETNQPGTNAGIAIPHPGKEWLRTSGG